MKSQMFSYLSADEKTMIRAFRFLPEQKPVGALQIIHGMFDHAGRYEQTAQYFANHGWAVYAADLIGHGASCENENQTGNIRMDLWSTMLLDTKQLSDKILSDIPDADIVLIGFSLGSLIARGLLSWYPGFYKAAVLIGASMQPVLATKLRRFAASRQAKLPEHKRNLDQIHELILKRFSRPFHTAAGCTTDWYIGDKAALYDFETDRYCRVSVTAEYVQTILTAQLYLDSRQGIRGIDPRTLLFLMSGQDDAVTDFTFLTTKLTQRLFDAGKHVWQTQFYAGRHDILHDEDRDKVHSDILSFLSAVSPFEQCCTAGPEKENP